MDLCAGPGEILGILGPNGAGKSTLLGALAGARRLSDGALRLFGDVVAAPRDAGRGMRRRIGFARDAPVHFDALTGRENAVFFARAAGLDARNAAAAVQELAIALRLERELDRPVGEYSFGMRRKLLLIGALAHSPDLVFLDEPTVGLDPNAIAALRTLLRDRTDRGATVILATNDVAEAGRACDRVLFLDDGQVVLAGQPRELIAQLGGRTRVEIRIAAERPPSLRLDGADVVHADASRIVVRTGRGAAVLPALCSALLDKGARIRSIRVREPDLRDVFRQATGRELVPHEPGGSDA